MSPKNNPCMVNWVANGTHKQYTCFRTMNLCNKASNDVGWCQMIGLGKLMGILSVRC